MNSVLGIGENIVFINKGYREWVGDKEKIFASTNRALNDFVFATDLFEEVREYILRNGRTAVGAARRDIGSPQHPESLGDIDSKAAGKASEDI